MTALRTLLLLGTLWLWGATTALAQQHLETDLLKDGTTTRSSFFNTTLAQHANLFKDRLELLELTTGQAGYLSFSFDHFVLSDIWIGLQDRDDPAARWGFQLVNGQITIDGSGYGACTAGALYRVERCDASIKFWVGGQLLLERTLSDINFRAIALVEVNAASLSQGQTPRLRLDFPYLSNCQSTQSVTSTTVYPQLKRELDGTFERLTSTTLRFHYEEDYAVAPGQNEALAYAIYDWDRANPVQSGTLNKRMGENFLDVPLAYIQSNRYYTLEVTNSKAQKKYLRFLHYCPPPNICITPPPPGLNRNNPGKDNSTLKTEFSED
ncbi:MAG: hypothetical protein AAFW73_18110 [Bacteroidota bacterium]